MTTDDGLKLLSREPTDEMLEHAISKATAPMTSVQVLIVKQSMAEVWRTMFDKAANVLDSGDGERYQHMRLHGVITGETSKDGCEWIYGDELDSQIDAAILAEKGEV